MKQYLKTNHSDIVRILRLTGYELGTLAAHWRGQFSLRQWKLLRSLRQSRGLKFNIASGRTSKSGWVNVDISPTVDIRMDLRRRIPLSAGSAAMIFCEHFCDHLNFPNEISRFLSECHRLLEPGGRARFVLHDAEGLLRAAIQRDAHYFEVAEQVWPTIMEAVNFLFRFNDAHQFLYDYQTFERLLLATGFAQVTRGKYRQSDCQELLLDFVHPSREGMSMYIDVVK